MRINILSICVFIFIFISSSRLAFAFNFYEGFDSNTLDTSIWGIIYQNNEGTVSIDNGIIRLDSIGEYVPLVYSKDGVKVFPDGDYNIKFKFRYTELNTNGQGLGIGYFNGGGFGVRQAAVWQDAPGGLMVFYDDLYKDMSCGDISKSLMKIGHLRYITVSSVFSSNWHIFEVEKSGSTFNIYLDREINTIPFYTYNQFLCTPAKIFFGNQDVGSSNAWNPLEIDYISVSDDGNLPTPTLLPTQTPIPTQIPTQVPTQVPTQIPTQVPTQTPVPTIVPTNTPTLVPTAVPTSSILKQKVIIIPGLGASWNTVGVVTNITVPNDQWAILPFVHNYDGLVQTLKSKGLDVYLWPYDWRHRVENISSELNDFINQKINPEEKFSLIGHSLGGLVARVWKQDHMSDLRINKVITLGSPHQGTLKSYEIWAGGEVPNDWGWKGTALNILLETQKQKYLTTTNMIHAVTPVFQDINPTFDFIKKKGNKITTWTNTSGANNYLSGKNNSLDKNNLDDLITISGIDKLTKRWILAEEPNKFDKAMMKWPDGRPISYLMDEGDGTILEKSANIDDLPNYQVNSPHSEMIDPSTPQILQILGLPVTNIIQSPIVNLNDTLVFFIGSPAYLSVKCGNLPEKISDSMGFVLVKRGKFNECNVRVVGTGAGTYHLVVGEPDEGSWRYYENEISPGEKDNYHFRVKDTHLRSNKNKLLIFELIRRDIRLLLEHNKNNKLLKKALVMAQRQNAVELGELIFAYRVESKEFQFTNRIMNYLYELNDDGNRGNSKVRARTLLKVNESNNVYIERRMVNKQKISIFQAQSWQIFISNLEKMRKLYQLGDFDGVEALNYQQEKLMREVI